MACISLLSFSLLGRFISSFVEAQSNHPETVELIHRDHLKSNSSKRPQSEIFSDSEGIYRMKISVGTPPVEILGIPSTANDFTWIQCSPCQPCYKSTTTLFNPKNSPTYTPIPSSSKQCPKDLVFRQGRGPNCTYNFRYSDGSSSRGSVASDNVTLNSTSGEPVTFAARFGCGFNNHGTFGVIGLGPGNLSLISQMGSLANRKFSYCLAATSSQANSSNISFGDIPLPSDSVVASLNPADSSYSLSLTGISVGSKKMKCPDLQTNSTPQSNIIIDLDTAVTSLPTKCYQDVQNAVASMTKLERKRDPKGSLGLRYEANDTSTAPNITMHFNGSNFNSANVVLPTMNTFLTLPGNLTCLTFRPTDGGAVGTLGTMAQINYLVAYDLKRKNGVF